MTVTKGLENIGTYNKTENSSRKFCMTCGGHLFTDHPSFEMVDVYHNVVPEMEHKPTVHVFYAMKSVAMKDSLPKFKDLPTDFGGSGEVLPE